MGLGPYLGFLGITLLVAIGVRWFDPSVVDQLSRKTGLGGATGWALLLVAAAWMFLPLLAGATAGDDELWVVGSAIAGLGFYLVTISVTSVGEYRLLGRTKHLAPDQVTTGTDETVATSGIPSVEEANEARTPFTALPSDHTDWIVQRRERIGLRTVWKNVAGGVQSVPFTLGDGAVRVTPGDGRVFSNAERITTFEPDGPLPDAVAAFVRSHPDLPAPGDRESKLQAVETYVPDDEPVTVVGIPRLGEFPGQCLIDRAPPDDLLGLGIRGMHSTDGGETDVVLVRGDADAAKRILRKRVYWLGIASVVMILGRQALAFWLSGASLAAFL
jgi:hypothetical protein